MSLESIVNVSITKETKSVSRAGFSTINIFGEHKGFIPLLQYYNSLTEVLADFLSTDPEAIAAGDIFAQSPSPVRIAISRRKTSDTTVVTVDTAVDDTDYTCTINGVEYLIDSGTSATVASIALALVTEINLGSEPVTATDNVDGTYDLVSDVASAPYSVKVDARQSMAFTTSQTFAEDLADISIAQDDWYGLVFTGRTLADVEDVADYIETVNKLFGTASDVADVIDTTDAADSTTIAAVLKAKSYVRTFVFYSAVASSAYPEASLLGSILPLNPGSWTAKFKTLTGIPIDTLTPTQKTNALAKNCNVFTEVGGENIVEDGTSAEGEWIDITVFIDWLQSTIKTNVFGLFVNKAKVAYVDSGIAAVEAEVTSALQQGASPSYGGIATDPPYSVTVPKAADISSADKAARELNDVTFQATLAGAIHATTIAGTVTV